MSRLLFRILVGMYPPACRRDYGAAMLATLDQRLRQHRARPISGRRSHGFVLREALGLLTGAVRQWAETLRIGDHDHRSLPSAGIRDAMRGFPQDVRYAFRNLIGNASFATVAIVTIALGVGANTAIFSIVNAVLLQPLPYVESDRLVRIWPGSNITKAIHERLQEESSVYVGTTVWSGWEFTITGVDEPESLSGGVVATSHFDVLGAAPMLGRRFRHEDSLPGNDDVVLLSHGLWQRRFGADPDIVGRRVDIGNDGAASRQVIGVMGPDHRPLRDEWELWAPLMIDPAGEYYYSSWYLQAGGRLRPQIALTEASAELAALLVRLGADDRLGLYDKEALPLARVVGLHEHTVGSVRTTLLVLLGGVALVLLIACTNVANLLLARSAARRRELAVRTALGAGRGRILAQLLTESVLLGLIGGVVGTALAVQLVGSVALLMQGALPRAEAISVDLVVLGYALSISILAGLLFVTAPALHSLRGDLKVSLADGAPGAGGSRGSLRTNQALVVAEVALSCILVVAAALLVRSLTQLWAVPSGFDARDVVTMRVTAPDALYADGPQRRQYWNQAMERVAAAAGVDSAGAIHILPLALGNWSFPFLAQGHEPEEGKPLPTANFRVVAADYFQTMAIPLIAGRLFDDGDGSADPGVVVVNHRLAEQYWPGESAIGKNLALFGNQDLEVVGVVGDVRQHRLDWPAPVSMYRPARQWPLASMVVAVRLQQGASVAPTMQAIRSLDSEVPISEVQSMREVMGGSLGRERLSAWLLSSFAALALVLGAVGVYGVMSCVVSRRTRDIGIRVALGAPAGTVVREVLAGGMAPVVIGVVLGLVGARLASRLLASMLFGVEPTDPSTYVAVALTLLLTALLAAILPARRASRVDPIVALRSD